MRAWRQILSDSRGTTLFVELTAAANHRAALQAEVAKLAHEVSEMQIAVLGPILAECGIDTKEFPPAWSPPRCRASPSSWCRTERRCDPY